MRRIRCNCRDRRTRGSVRGVQSVKVLFATLILAVVNCLDGCARRGHDNRDRVYDFADGDGSAVGGDFFGKSRGAEKSLGGFWLWLNDSD